jgi:hypothetical protein
LPENGISGRSKKGSYREWAYPAGTKTRQYFKTRDQKNIIISGFFYAPLIFLEFFKNGQTRLKNICTSINYARLENRFYFGTKKGCLRALQSWNIQDPKSATKIQKSQKSPSSLLSSNQSIMLRTLFHIFTVTLLYKSHKQSTDTVP